jgi:predicted XRE-type DNA-binding protein
MIKTDSDLKSAMQDIEKNQQLMKEQAKELMRMGLSCDQIAVVTAPIEMAIMDMSEQVTFYKSVLGSADLPRFTLASLGKMLIVFRLRQGITQRELAVRLDVSEAQVSRDETNEYSGVSIEKAMRVLSAMGGHVRCEFRDA